MTIGENTPSAPSESPKRKTPFYKNWVFWFVICLFLAVVGGQSERESNKPSTSSKEKTTMEEPPKITKYSVVGMYAGPGLYGWPCTVELLFGGSFIQKDPGLPRNSTYYGDWTIEGEQVCFYGNGQKMFTATVEDGSLYVSGRVWKKVR
jgi:hypothetical protein